MIATYRSIFNKDNTVLLIDADSKIPNLALMKLSTYYKKRGFDVELLKLNISYYPNRKNSIQYIPSGYYKTFCSVIFQGSIDYIKGKNIEFGGTGYDLLKRLPKEIENCELDYSLYPENKIAYGFITRGCIRNCYFCVVPKKEGRIHLNRSIDKIVDKRFKVVHFLDNNILAYPDHKKILQEITNKEIKCSFIQGLDIRLVDKENSVLLSKLRYDGNYTFAFDDLKYKKIIEKKLKILSWRKDWQLRFYVYIHPNMEIKNIWERVEFLRENRCLPYAMRDRSCWNSKHKRLYSDIASYCNQPSFFKKLSFSEFVEKRYSYRS